MELFYMPHVQHKFSSFSIVLTCSINNDSIRKKYTYTRYTTSPTVNCLYYHYLKIQQQCSVFIIRCMIRSVLCIPWFMNFKKFLFHKKFLILFINIKRKSWFIGKIFKHWKLFFDKPYFYFKNAISLFFFLCAYDCHLPLWFYSNKQILFSLFLSFSLRLARSLKSLSTIELFTGGKIRMWNFN